MGLSTPQLTSSTAAAAVAGAILKVPALLCHLEPHIIRYPPPPRSTNLEGRSALVSLRTGTKPHESTTTRRRSSFVVSTGIKSIGCSIRTQWADLFGNVPPPPHAPPHPTAKEEGFLLRKRKSSSRCALFGFPARHYDALDPSTSPLTDARYLFIVFLPRSSVSSLRAVTHRFYPLHI